MDSGASMHMISKKDLNSAELETVTTSRSPTTVFTANGEVQTNAEASVYVRELDIFWDNETPRGYASSSIARKALRRTWILNMSGSRVKNHNSLKMVFEYSAIRQISYRAWFLVYLQLLQARLPQHPRPPSGQEIDHSDNHPAIESRETLDRCPQGAVLAQCWTSLCSRSRCGPAVGLDSWDAE